MICILGLSSYYHDSAAVILLDNGWMRFGAVMNKVTTPLILSIIYFVLITPLGLVMRVFASDPITRKLDNSVNTYRLESQVVDADNQRRDDQRCEDLERSF
jgi:hypothetical protein